jgi:cation transport protein ChaC
MSAEDFKRGAIEDDTAAFSEDSAESDLAAAGVESAMVFHPSRGSVIFPKIKVPPGSDLWVFGYGSLMWNPEFPYAERRQALLRGYHRRFCVYSHRYRGTPDRPGLVLGLDRGGSCRGIAFRVEPPHVEATIDLLWDREMVSGVYAPKIIKVATDEGRIPACTFVADRAHRQYCGELGPSDVVRFIRQGVGERGPNRDYLANTVGHLRDLGIVDQGLERLLAEIGKS